jgi:phosphomannomutase
MKKAFIADIDDTVCPSTRPMSPEMAAEIDRIVRGGQIFAFISGSTMGQISAQVTPLLHVAHQILAVSGSHYVTVDYPDGAAVFKEVYRHEFAPEEKARVLTAFERLMERHDIRSRTTREDQLQDRGSQITLSAIGRNAAETAKRSFDPDGSRREVWIKELVQELGTGYNIRRGGTSSIDITPAGIDKEWGIRRFLEHNGLNPEEALFFGDNLQDGGNDNPALRVVQCVPVYDPGDTLRIFRDEVKLTSRIVPAGTSYIPPTELKFGSTDSTDHLPRPAGNEYKI